MTTHKSFCRICQAFCGTLVTVEEGRVAQVRGDRDDPVSHGFACFKGLQAPEQHYGPGRLLRPLARRNGALVGMGSSEALVAAGNDLKAIVAAHGPQSVAVYIGTQSLFNALTPPMAGAFATAIGTPRLFGTMTIDQSAKWIGEARLGLWEAGPQDFDTADIWMFVGSNPLVSMVAGAGAQQFAFTDPVRTMKAAKARGMKIIVVDPRRSDIAEYADLHLALRPGTDALLFAAMLRTILAEGWEDAAFCRDHAAGLDDLRSALKPFSPDLVAAEVGVPDSLIVQAARMFAHESKSGMAGSGTGPDMARHSNLAEHLIQLLNIVCGRFQRAGDPIVCAGALQPLTRRRAQTAGPTRWWETGPRSLAHGLGTMKGQMMSAEIADDILHPNDERIRALICIGGNPAMALPDQVKALEALAALDLLIVIDPRLTATARRAHYVFPPTLQYERPDHTGLLERIHRRSFAHVTPAIVSPPESADVVDDWFVLWSLARDLGKPLMLAGQPVPMDVPPSTQELLARLIGDPAMSFESLISAPGARLSARAPVAAAADSQAGRFDLLPGDVAADLAALAAEPEQDPSGYVLIVRRQRDVMNSAGTDFAATQRRQSTSAAFFHPDDLSALGVSPGTPLVLKSAAGSIHANAAPDATLRRGTVSMTHSWAGSAEHAEEATNRLVDAECSVQALNRMPVMTGIRVEIEFA